MRPLLLAVSLLLLPAVPAQAATVTSDGVTAEYVAGAGESNRLTISFDGPDLLRFTESGAALEPRGECFIAYDTVVRCRARAANVRVGDGDDWVFSDPDGTRRPEQSLSVFGEDGPDMLTGTNHADALDGGPGDDEIRARGGNDTLVPGPGADRVEADDGDDILHVADGVAGSAPFAEAPTAPDSVAGGAGVDSATFAGDPRPVGIDLATAETDGAAEGDAFAGVENLSAGAGTAAFAGDDGPNDLVSGEQGGRVAGRGGNDRLSGRGGPDTLDGGAGDDLLDGGPHPGTNTLVGGAGDDIIRLDAGGFVDAGDGDDRVELYGTPLDPLRIVCGPGTDVAGAAGRSTTARDCEWLGFGAAGAEVGSPLRLRGRTAVLTLRAPEGASGRLVVRTRFVGRRVAAARWRGRGAARPVFLRVRVSRATARAARRPGGLAVTVAERGVPERRAVTRLAPG